MDTSCWSRWTTIVSVLILALIAAVVSYSHMYELALRHGEPEWRAALFPLSVDGMIVASSMTLLSDARNGRKGGLLPWALLIIGSGASLAANVAVADPTMWSRIIHAWPSFALIGAYELLMREFRANASGVRSTHAGRTPGEDAASDGVGSNGATSETTESFGQEQERRHLHVVPTQNSSPEPVVTERVDHSVMIPQVQREAWDWALENRREDGSLPTGKQIAEACGHKPRWGRLIKQWGREGKFDHAAA
ncbi:DUF2637 domain-containing protein [Nocardiopsis nanhaiensis]